MNERKWNLFLKRLWPFQFMPFADFVFAAGSLATGKIHEDSDFDVLVGVRQGRIFTARFCAVVLFRLLGWGRKAEDSKESAKDKICLNHFVTSCAYRLSPPHNEYWKLLYQSLVPVYGSPAKIQAFWDANQDWMGMRKVYAPDQRHQYQKKSWIQNVLELLLSGFVGDWVERQLKKIQLQKIVLRQKQNEYQPRLIVSDEELEFHPHTQRIEEFLENKK